MTRLDSHALSQAHAQALSKRRRLALLSGLLGTASLMAACGGGSDSASTDGTPVAAAPAPAAATPATPSPAPSASPTPSPSPAPSASPSPSPTPAPAPAPTPTPSPSPPPPPPPPPAPPAPAPSPATADTTCGLANFQADALRLINARRAAGASCGANGNFPAAAALTWNTPLTQASYGHSLDMATKNYFSHTSADGRTLGTRVTASGYAWSAIGENIAAGYGSVQAVVDGWMASDGHCANLMNANFVHIGLACARSSSSTYGTYWTLDLGRPR